MTRTIAHIGDFFSITPPLCSQEQIVDWTICYVAAATHADDTHEIRERFKKYGVGSDKIASRGFECAQIDASTELSVPALYRLDEAFGTGPALEKRSVFFLEKTNQVFEQLYTLDKRAPNHIVHVTCTGYVSPSAPQRLVIKNGWETEITHSYHMGCYASLPSIRTAAGQVALNSAHDNKHRVDVVHTEICSLHLNPQLSSSEQTIVQTLFADGHIKYSVGAPGTVKKGFAIHGIKEKLITNSTDQMTWQPEHYGFRMTLGRNVPVYIRNSIRQFVSDLVTEVGWDLADVLKNAVFAIHPGGPRIIDYVQEALELNDSQTEASKMILRSRGNMSSATLPHVWQTLADNSYAPGTKVISLAFGPGLTVFGGAFTTL